MIADRERHRRQREHRRQCRRFAHPLPREDAPHHQHEPQRGTLQHFTGPPVAQVQSHEDRDRHGRRNRECPPRAALQGIHHHQADHRQQNHHNQQHRHQCHEAAHPTDLLARHLPQRFPVPPHRCEQNHEILHRPAQARADDDPQRPWQVSELSRQHRTHQRSRPGDRREVMAEYDPLIGRLEIVPVAQAFGRCGPLVIQRHHACRDELAVKTEGRGIAARRRHHQPQAVDVLPANQCDTAQSDPRCARHRCPDEIPQDPHCPRVY